MSMMVVKGQGLYSVRHKAFTLPLESWFRVKPFSFKRSNEKEYLIEASLNVSRVN